MDKGEESWTKRDLRTKEIDNLLREQSRRECILYKRNSIIERSLKSTYAFIKKALVSNELFNEKLDKTMSKCQDQESYVLGTYGHYFLINSVFGEPKEYEFEGRNYFGPQDADTYLTSIYGNYLRLPPEEQRTKVLDQLIGEIR